VNSLVAVDHFNYTLASNAHPWAAPLDCGLAMLVLVGEATKGYP